MMLAGHFGGGPAYWLDPELPDELLATALAALPKRKRKGRQPDE